MVECPEFLVLQVQTGLLVEMEEMGEMARKARKVNLVVKMELRAPWNERKSG